MAKVPAIPSTVTVQDQKLRAILEAIRRRIESISSDTTAYASLQKVQSISDDITAHLVDYNNPHQTTAAQVNAAPLSHTTNYNDPHRSNWWARRYAFMVGGTN